jgi:hypothetical protein
MAGINWALAGCLAGLPVEHAFLDGGMIIVP